MYLYFMLYMFICLHFFIIIFLFLCLYISMQEYKHLYLPNFPPGSIKFFWFWLRRGPGGELLQGLNSRIGPFLLCTSIQCKILHQIHHTNINLSKIYPCVSDACKRRKQSPAYHIHMFQSCPKLINIWLKISRAHDVIITPIPSFTKLLCWQNVPSALTLLKICVQAFTLSCTKVI